MRSVMVILGLLGLVGGCSVGPDYQRPAAPVPPAYKEQAPGAGAGWKPATPQRAASDAPWWRVFNDPVLDGLLRQIDVSNQNVAAAEAAWRQAVAAAASSRAGLWPSLTAGASGQRAQSSTRTGNRTVTRTGNSFDLSLGTSWDADLWGRLRRGAESADATAQAGADDLAAARLSAQATLAQLYMQLRIADDSRRLFDTTATAYARALQITRNQYDSGLAARADVVQAETQLKQAQAQAIDTGVARAQYEHAIAVLVGLPPASLTIPPAPTPPVVPGIPAGLPSALLERRPDIAAAERRMAAANARIGVAVAAWYPSLTLGGNAGFAGSALDTLVRASNGLWSFGPQLAQTLLDGGQRRAATEEARAAYDEAVARYRQTVLVAFQEVEDQLAILRILEAEAQVQAEALRSAERAVELVFNQYRAGTLPYTSVITAQATALGERQKALAIVQQRLVAAVLLIQALGGGWSAGR